MKKKILTIPLVLLFACCNAQIKREVSYAESFFNKKMQSQHRKKFEHKIICPMSKLDSILQSDSYHIARFFDDLQFFPKDSSLIILLKNDKDINWSRANENCEFNNNVYVIFKKQQENFILSEFIYYPLNQGFMALSFIDMEIKDEKLYLYQYGGNRFGTWGTEMEFENNGDNWFLSNSKLFTTVDNLDNEMKKLIWSKVPKKKLPLNQVCFTDIFDPEELGLIMDGVYSEN